MKYQDGRRSGDRERYWGCAHPAATPVSESVQGDFLGKQGLATLVDGTIHGELKIEGQV